MEKKKMLEGLSNILDKDSIIEDESIRRQNILIYMLFVYIKNMSAGNQLYQL